MKLTILKLKKKTTCRLHPKTSVTTFTIEWSKNKLDRPKREPLKCRISWLTFENNFEYHIANVVIGDFVAFPNMLKAIKKSIKKYAHFCVCS